MTRPHARRTCRTPMPRSHVVVPNVALAPVGRTSTIAGACSAIRNQFSKRCKAQGKVNSSGAHTPSLAPPKLHGGSLTLTVYPRYQNRPTWAPARRRWDTSRHWPVRFFENIRLVDQSVHFCAAVVHHSKFGSAMSQMGHSRPFEHAPATSVVHPTPDISLRRTNLRVGPLVPPCYQRSESAVLAPAAQYRGHHG